LNLITIDATCFEQEMVMGAALDVVPASHEEGTLPGQTAYLNPTDQLIFDADPSADRVEVL